MDCLFSFFSYSQNTNCVDVRYIEAIKYFENNDSIKKEIKKHMGKKALNYKIQDTLIQSQIGATFERKDFAAFGVSKQEIKSIDSINWKLVSDTTNKIVKSFSSFSTATRSNYELKFSPITRSFLYAKFTTAPFITLSDGSVYDSNQSGIYMVFLFDDKNALKKTCWSYVFYEGGTVFLSDKPAKEDKLVK